VTEIDLTTARAKAAEAIELIRAQLGMPAVAARMDALRLKHPDANPALFDLTARASIAETDMFVLRMHLNHLCGLYGPDGAVPISAIRSLLGSDSWECAWCKQPVTGLPCPCGQGRDHDPASSSPSEGTDKA
jgi:predicted component of type VI protein secretion system